MPSGDEVNLKPLWRIVQEVGVYPAEAFEFVHRGLQYTVRKLHGQEREEGASHHVTGQQLCQGLRELALLEWGLLARTVLQRWNISGTIDFGRIVYALVENGHMSKTDSDCLDDFRNVYDFSIAFEGDYRIEYTS